MKRLLIVLLLVPGLAWGAKPRLGWYTSGGLTLDSTVASDSVCLVDTLINGGYEYIGGIGGNGITYLRNNAPGIITMRYQPAMWMQATTAGQGYVDSVYQAFASQGVHPYRAWLRLARSWDEEATITFDMTAFDSTGIDAGLSCGTGLVIDSVFAIWRLKAARQYDTIDIQRSYDTGDVEIIIDTVELTDYSVSTQPEILRVKLTGPTWSKLVLDGADVNTKQTSRNTVIGAAILHACGFQIYSSCNGGGADTVTYLTPNSVGTREWESSTAIRANSQYWGEVNEAVLGNTDGGIVTTASFSLPDATNPRFDGFARVSDAGASHNLMKTEGLWEKASGWTDFTEAGYANSASITFSSGDTIYFGDYWPNDSLRLDLSQAASSGGTLAIEYYDTSDAWVAVDAEMVDTVLAMLESGTSEIVRGFVVPPDIGKWKYNVVNSGTYYLAWCRMYWTSAPATVPIISGMKRAAYIVFNPDGTVENNTVIAFGWDGGHDTNSDGWLDSCVAADTTMRAIAACDAYSAWPLREADDRRYSGQTTILPRDTIPHRAWGFVFAAFTDTALNKVNGINFDQYSGTSFPYSHSEDSFYQVFDTIATAASRDSFYLQNMVTKWHAAIQDSIEGSRGGNIIGFTAGSMASVYGGNGENYARCGQTQTFWSNQLRRFDSRHPDVDSAALDDYFYGTNMLFMEDIANANTGGIMWNIAGGVAEHNRILEYPYEFICSNQGNGATPDTTYNRRLLAMFNIGYSPTYPTRYFCDSAYRDIYLNYMAAWYWIIRPGGTGADTVYDKLVVLGGYAGVDGQSVSCYGNRSDSRTPVWGPGLKVDIGEPANPMDFTASYCSLIVNTPWFEWLDTGAVDIQGRWFVTAGTSDTVALALFRTDDKCVGQDCNVSTYWGTVDSTRIDTFSLGSAYEYKRLYIFSGDTVSPVTEAVATADTLVALMPADGAILLRQGAVTCRINAAPASLVFTDTVGTGNPTDQEVVITNSGDTTAFIKWTAAKGETWLSIDLDNGTDSAGQFPDTITVSVSLSGLSADTYYDTLTITDTTGCADNTPLDIPVVLNLIAAPASADTAFQYRGLNLRGVNIGMEIDHGTEETTEGRGRDHPAGGPYADLRKGVLQQ